MPYVQCSRQQNVEPPGLGPSSLSCSPPSSKQLIQSLLAVGRIFHSGGLVTASRTPCGWVTQLGCPELVIICINGTLGGLRDSPYSHAHEQVAIYQPSLKNTTANSDLVTALSAPSVKYAFCVTLSDLSEFYSCSTSMRECVTIQ